MLTTETALLKRSGRSDHERRSFTCDRWRELPAVRAGRVYAVEEPYSVYVGDDDFLVPQSLELCTEFLDAHPNYATAHGKAVLTCTSAHGRVEFASRYAQRAVPHERASARLTDLLGEYFVLQFSVQRTAWFREDLDVVATVADLSFTELLSSSLSIVRGPAWEVDRMSLVRVHHENRQSLPDMYDWITDSKWLPAYEVFSKCLAERIVAQDGVAPEAASETVKEAFWAYLAKGLKTKWAGRYAHVSISSRFKEIGRQVPGLVGAWERVRSTIPGDKRFSLPALLRRSSPYHDDFLPICRAIEASGDGR